MAALRAAVFTLSAKNRRGGHFLHPPSSARVKENYMFLNSLWPFKNDYYRNVSKESNPVQM